MHRREGKMQKSLKYLFPLSFLNRVGIVVFLLTFLAFHSCNLSPKYQRPCVEMPDHWRVSTDETATTVNQRWWEQFRDPVLNALIEEALESNNDLRISTARIFQFQAQLGIVGSQLYPQIFGQGIASRQRTSQTLANDIALLNGDSNTSYPSYGGGNAGVVPELDRLFPVYNSNYFTAFTASYAMDLWGKIRNATRASYAELLGQYDARRTVILTVVSSVAASYILLRQYDMQLKVSIQTYESRKEYYRLAKIRFEEGLTSELEVVQAAAEMDEAEIQVIRYQTLIPQQENLLSILIGHPPAAIRRGLQVYEFGLAPEIPAGLPADILEQRPDIMQAEQQMLAANFRIGEAKALYFPDITLTGNYGVESAQLRDLFTSQSKVWQWMVNLLQPIFTGWKITSQVDLAKAKKQEAIYNYLQVILKAFREVDDALIGHVNAKREVVAEKTRVKDLQEYLHLATLQYDNGLVDYLNVLDAQRRLFDSQLDLAQQEADVFLTLVNIYKSLGGGWVVNAENMMNYEWTHQGYPPPVCNQPNRDRRF